MTPRPPHEPAVGAGRPPARPVDTPTPTPMSPADLAAFVEFYRAKAPALVAFLRWQGAAWQDARDCAQEALTQCFRQWATITTPHAWCRTVASRLYSRRIASVENPVENVELAGNPVLLRADADLDRLEDRHAVLQMLEQLPLRQRQVVAWYYDGASDAETADALKISPEAVRKNRSLGLAKLRLLMSEGEDA